MVFAIKDTNLSKSMSIEKFYSDIPRIEVTVQEVEKVMEYKNK